MVDAKLVLGLVILAVLLYFLTPLGSLISESSAFTQCTKVSGTEASCNFYNRGTSPGISHDTVEMPRFNEWAGKNGITYNQCKVTSVSVGTVGGCSCGPGSGSYGCACSTPKQTDANTAYPATGDTCPIKFDRWYSDASGPADSYNNGGKAVSYSGTVVFFSETPKCGSQITCGEWSACTDYHEKQRVCVDECNIQTTEKAYCDPSVPQPEPVPQPIGQCTDLVRQCGGPCPPCPEEPISVPPPTPTTTNLLDYIIFRIRGWLSMIGINL